MPRKFLWTCLLKAMTWCLSTRADKGPASATVHSSSRYRTRGGDTWMGVGLATSPKLDRIPLARERGMSKPVSDLRLSCWSQLKYSGDRNSYQEQQRSFATLLTLQMILEPSSLGQHAWYSLPAQNPQVAYMLKDRDNTTALTVTRGKNLRICWGPQVEKKWPKLQVLQVSSDGMSLALLALRGPFKFSLRIAYEKIPAKQI